MKKTLVFQKIILIAITFFQCNGAAAPVVSSADGVAYISLAGDEAKGAIPDLANKMDAWFKEIEKANLKGVQKAIDDGLRSNFYYEADCRHLRAAYPNNPFATAVILACEEGRQLTRNLGNTEKYENLITIFKAIYGAGNCNTGNDYQKELRGQRDNGVLWFVSIYRDNRIAMELLNLRIPNICYDLKVKTRDFDPDVEDRITNDPAYRKTLAKQDKCLCCCCCCAVCIGVMFGLCLR